MINVKEENKRQSNNIKEGTNEFLDNQRQQFENTTSNVSELTNKIKILSMTIKEVIYSYIYNSFCFFFKMLTNYEYLDTR